MNAEQNNLAATVFVYRSRIDGRIQTAYLETAMVMEKSPDWEHIATLEPRWWIQAHYDAVAQRDELLEALKDVLNNCLDSNGLAEAYAKARAAIAKATGNES
jgi:hemoglobin-like flavoprotein